MLTARRKYKNEILFLRWWVGGAEGGGVKSKKRRSCAAVKYVKGWRMDSREGMQRADHKIFSLPCVIYPTHPPLTDFNCCRWYSHATSAKKLGPLRDYDPNEEPRREAPFPLAICIYSLSRALTSHAEPNASATLSLNVFFLARDF